MSVDPRKPEGFERLEAAAATALDRARKDPSALRAESEGSVRRWEHATGEYHSAHPLGSEYVSKVGPGVLTQESTSAIYDFGFDERGRLRAMVAHPPEALGVRSACTWYEDDLEVTAYFEEDRQRQKARASGLMICWRDPHTPTILVVRRGDALYREVIDLGEHGRARVHAASSGWRSFGLQVDYEVQLDASGRARRVATAEGTPLYERPRRALAPLLRDLARDLPSELERGLSKSARSTSAGQVVLSHGVGPELFPPMLHVVVEPCSGTGTLAEALEAPSTYEALLYSEDAPPWVNDLVAWLPEDAAQAKILATLQTAVESMNRKAKKGGFGPVTLLCRE